MKSLKKKMKKTIINIILVLILTNTGFSNDKKPVSFLTATGNTIGDAHARAHNIAYMNGMKIIGRNTVKSGGMWVTTVTLVPKH